jgi:hypothetical protein
VGIADKAGIVWVLFKVSGSLVTSVKLVDLVVGSLTEGYKICVIQTVLSELPGVMQSTEAAPIVKTRFCLRSRV